MRDKIRVNARAYAITGVLLGTVLGVAREGHAQKLRVPGRMPEGDYASELRTAYDRLRKGTRARARLAFEEILEAVVEEEPADQPSKAEQAEALEGLARLDAVQGRYSEARKRLDQARALAVQPDQNLVEARVLLRTGGFARAQKLLTSLVSDRLADRAQKIEARYLLARLRDATGKHEEATRQLLAIEEEGKKEALPSVPAKLFYACALSDLGSAQRLYEASRLFLEITKEDPYCAEAYVGLGDLNYRVYREARGRPSGESEYKRALDRCGEVESALIGLYVSRKDNYLLDSSKTGRYLARALAVNPKSVPAMCAKAARLIDDRAFEPARSILLEALEIHPKDRRTIAELIAASNLTYRFAEERKYRKLLASIDPSYGPMDSILGRHLCSLYRFADAIPYFMAALRKDENDVDTLVGLGRALIYSGRGDQAYRYLRKSREIEKGFLRPWRENQMAVQERIDRSYKKIEQGNFVYVVSPDESGVMLPYLSETYEEAWRMLGTKYGIFPPCKVRVEDYERFGDFSVRTVGFKGFGALGACFGCFITSVSPRAPELRSQFSWKVTAWHEFSHVLHLHLSKARVPRWLTEGMAVYEEMSLDPSYDRRMERELKTALVNDSIFPLLKLNTAFRGPKILFGYYQGGLIAKYLAREYGFPKLVALVKAYGEDKSTAQIFKGVLGLNPKDFDRRFKNYITDLVGGYDIEARVEDQTMARLLLFVAKNPMDVGKRLLLAQGFRQRGNVIDCGTQLAAIRKLDPENGTAFLVRAKLALARKDLRQARSFLKKGFANGGDDFDARMAYADILRSAGREDDALLQYEKALAC